MGLKFYNTLTRTVELFVPRDPAGRKAGLYCCGPTVHDYAHIGNFRTFVFADLVRRQLEFRGYEVEHVMNITDIEDKIIARVRTAGIGRAEYTAKYESAFLEDLDFLRCAKPHRLPRATEHIAEIIRLIEALIARGFAYQAPDRSVYFSIEKYRAAGHLYGQLTKLNLDEMRAGERVRGDEYAKEALGDFALWKARIPDDGEIFWPSPWGEGRPGWHIECSAMSMKLLGPSFDLHLGGEDLIFPHHEDEIAQSEGAGQQAPGQRFVGCWMHGAHLLVEGKKMSKSLGNYFTLRDLRAQDFSGAEIRQLLLSAHYRESFNFTLEGLRGARSALGRIYECLAKLNELAGLNRSAATPDRAILSEVGAALDDDLNVSAAWAALFDWVRALNKQMAANQLEAGTAAAALAAWDNIDLLFAVGPASRQQVAGGAAAGESGEGSPPLEISHLLEARQMARRAKDFAQADAIRGELKSKGWVIEDTPKGPRLKRV